MNETKISYPKSGFRLKVEHDHETEDLRLISNGFFKSSYVIQVPRAQPEIYFDRVDPSLIEKALRLLEKRTEPDLKEAYLAILTLSLQGVGKKHKPKGGE